MEESGQRLADFYCIDKWKHEDPNEKKKKKRGKGRKLDPVCTPETVKEDI